MKIGCPSILFILGVVLVVLKGSGVIDWPWIWVTFPIWITLIAFLVLMVLALVYLVSERLFEEK